MQSAHHPNPFLFFPSLPHPAPPSHHHSLPQDTRTQLFVNNLPFRVRWQDLKDLFRKAGTVLRADVSLTSENRSKGFGTVLFANRTDAFKAVEIYNGFTWQTRILDVRLDQQDPTGALGMAAAAAPVAIPPIQQKQHQHQPQLLQPNHHHHPHSQQHPHQLVAYNGLNHPSQCQHPAPPTHSLQFPTPTVNLRAHLNHNGTDSLLSADVSSAVSTTSNELHRSSSTHPQQFSSIHNALPPARPASVNADGSNSTNFIVPPSSLPARRLSSNPELPNSLTNKPVPSYQKHQHSQSLIPFSSNFPDQTSNVSQLAFNSCRRSSSHRSSRSVQFFTHHVTPPASSSTTTSSQPPPSHGLDVHQPEFKPAAESMTHALSQLELSNHKATSPIPSVVISSVTPNPASSPHPASIESLPQGSLPQASTAHHHTSAINFNPPSSLRPNSSQGSVSENHPAPSFHHYGVSPPYAHRIMPPNTSQRGLYSSNLDVSSRLLIVGNLPFNFQWQDLKDLFRQAGNILRADVATTVEGRSRGFGTVLFATAEGALKALEMYEGYELNGRTLKVHFDHFTHMPPSETGGDDTWSEPAAVAPPKFYSMHPNQQPDHLSILPPDQQVKGAIINDAVNPNQTSIANKSSSDQLVTENLDDQRSELWAPEPVRNGHRPSLPLIIPPPLSPIASRRSSYLKSNNSSEYTQPNCEAQRKKSGNGPEPIGHPSSLSRPQAIPLPPPYDLKGLSTGMMSPAIPKVIQMTPSMPAFSFQAFMPATPPLLPQFFSPGIGPPSTPPYGRGGGTPSPGAKPINSPLGVSSIFPIDVDQSEIDGANIVHSIIGSEEKEEAKEPVNEEKPKKTLDSNVDWGYQSPSIFHNRRASLFVGRATGNNGNVNLSHNISLNQRYDPEQSGDSSINPTTTSLNMNNQNGFSGRRLLGVGEELAEDRFSENYSRRASFDVSSLLHNKHHRQSGKLIKTRPKNILISTNNSVENKADNEKLESNNCLKQKNKQQDHHHQDNNFLINSNQSDRLDLVGLGFVESIWTKKE